jgi:hypothetical protein
VGPNLDGYKTARQLFDWAKASEMRDAVLDFRRSGKKVYAVFEESPDAGKIVLYAGSGGSVQRQPGEFLA